MSEKPVPPVIRWESREELELEQAEEYVRGNREGEFLGWVRNSMEQKRAMFLMTRLLFRLLVRVSELERRAHNRDVSNG